MSNDEDDEFYDCRDDLDQPASNGNGSQQL